ncbi:MAG: tRNA pseudouridine(55) synthase TruB [Candidatus Saccharibacteria bacterium]
MENEKTILIDKPSGMTSFGVVARIRRILSQKSGKKIKVGHTGTLDPFATGLLILVIGNECKNASSYSKLDKVYEATIRLGQTSSTGDPEGEMTDVSTVVPEETDIKKATSKFIGKIVQRPPIFSAIKINGQRAYKLARGGEKIEMPERKVTVYNLEVINYSYPEILIKTKVSSGTYIRSLAEDIGRELGIGAYCSQLRRTKIGTWRIEDSKELSDYGNIY